MTDITDDDLMRMFRDGDADAFDVLFDRHNRAVYTFAQTLLCDAHQALDVLQESFLTVARKSADYEPRGHFKTWLLRICRNRCFNIMEANRLRTRITEESGFEILQPADSAPAPDEAMDRDERVALVRARMASLPQRQREAIGLFAFENMKYREIADVLDMPVNTVKTLIHRARQSLADALQGE